MKKSTFVQLQILNGRNTKTLRKLTEREIELLEMAADGLSNKQIAFIMNISTCTVDKHSRNIVNALGAKNMKHAVAIGFRKKLIK